MLRLLMSLLGEARILVRAARAPGEAERARSARAPGAAPRGRAWTCRPRRPSRPRARRRAVRPRRPAPSRRAAPCAACPGAAPGLGSQAARRAAQRARERRRRVRVHVRVAAVVGGPDHVRAGQPAHGEAERPASLALADAGPCSCRNGSARSRRGRRHRRCPRTRAARPSPGTPWQPSVPHERRASRRSLAPAAGGTREDGATTDEEDHAACMPRSTPRRRARPVRATGPASCRGSRA